MYIFFLVLGFMTIWHFLPEFIFPFLGSLAFLCWVAPENATANFIGSGFGGMGFLNLSLDWSNINPNGLSLFLTPWWTQVIIFAAFAFNVSFHPRNLLMPYGREYTSHIASKRRENILLTTEIFCSAGFFFQLLCGEI